MHVTPTQSQVEQLVAAEDDGPVVMLNLLRLKDEADGIDTGLSGVEAYARYGEAAAPFLERVHRDGDGPRVPEDPRAPHCGVG